MDLAVDPHEKGSALSAVETSEIFSRQDQLKAFLRFVCEYEIAGRGGELHEYLIGTEVFGQEDGYSTTENSVVRRRAHTLRQKLADFYATEGVAIDVRIVMPKGSYCPRFVRMSVSDTIPWSLDKSSSEIAATPAVPLDSGLKRNWNYLLAFGFLAGCLISVFIGYRLSVRPVADGVAPIIRDAWGPLISPDSNAIICIATNAQLQLFALPDGSTDAPQIPGQMNLESWYGQHYRPLHGEHLYYYPNTSTPVWGDAAGAVFISKVLTKAGVASQVLPDRVLDPFVLRDRNIVLLGRPANSPAVTLLLGGLYYNMKWFPDVKDMEVYFSDPQTNVATRLEHKNDSVHGLITVIRSTNREGNAIQALIISGTNSAGTLGAVEFFSSSDRMKEFKGRLIHDGYKTLPRVYQIVISTEATSETSQFLPFKSSLETYKVITQ